MNFSLSLVFDILDAGFEEQIDALWMIWLSSKPPAAPRSSVSDGSPWSRGWLGFTGQQTVM